MKPLPYTLALAFGIASSIAHAAGMGTAFTYQGHLENPPGIPVDGVACDFRFGLWDAADGGNQKGDSPQTETAVDVVVGVFTVGFLDFGPGAFDGTARWLEIEVQCPGDAGFVLLEPRQELTPAPNAIRAWEGVGPPSALEVDTATGRVGLGTLTPAEKLHVVGNVEVDGTVFAHALSSSGPLQLQTGGVTRVYIDDATGTVGIGTIGPVAEGSETVQLLAARLPSGRYAPSCAADPTSEAVYCFGGTRQSGPHLTNQVVRFDPGSGTVEVQSATLPEPSAWMSCAASNLTDKIYCFGGYSEPGLRTETILEYEPATDTLTVLPAVLPWPTQTMACATDTASGRIYCFGGYPEEPHVSDDIIEFDPGTGDVTVKTSTLPTLGFSACASGPPGIVYCFGGLSPTLELTDEIFEYVTGTDTVSVLPYALPFALTSSCAWSPASARAYCFGGSADWWLDEIIQFEPGVGATVLPVTLSHSSAYHSCAASANGAIYCFGGLDYPNGQYDDIVEFRPDPFGSLLQVGDPGDGSGAMANAWGLFSSRSFKEDIQALTPPEYKEALDKLLATDVVRYRYTGDPRRTPHLGVIAEESPAEILATGGKAVSLGDYNAFLLAGLKAQQEAIGELRHRNLELEARLSRVEGLLEAAAGLHGPSPLPQSGQ